MAPGLRITLIHKQVFLKKLARFIMKNKILLIRLNAPAFYEKWDYLDYRSPDRMNGSLRSRAKLLFVCILILIRVGRR